MAYLLHQARLRKYIPVSPHRWGLPEPADARDTQIPKIPSRRLTCLRTQLSMPRKGLDSLCMVGKTVSTTAFSRSWVGGGVGVVYKPWAVQTSMQRWVLLLRMRRSARHSTKKETGSAALNRGRLR
jgi:hypothetical protein